jgi:glycosyltransferase involved in cell wall biosynthesis
MKICIIGDGDSVHMLRMADWLRVHGHRVQMISMTPTSPKSSTHYDECVDMVRRPGFRGYISRVLPIRKYVRNTQPDIVHGHYLTAGGLYAAWSGHDVVFTSAWGSDVYQDPKHRSLRWLLRSAIKGSDVVTGDSDHILNAVRGYCPDVRTYKFLFGVETSLFVLKPELKPKVFTFFSGRASYPLYNPIRIVKAFELLENTDSILLLQRSKNPYPELEEVVAKSPVKGRIERYGWIDHAKMPELYGRVNVTVSIPNSDSSSAVMMESMACGVPVIASKIPANDEWDGMGIFIPRDDSVEALAELMQKLMKEPELLKANGKFAREIIIQRADWDKQMEGLVKLYEELVEGKK